MMSNTTNSRKWLPNVDEIEGVGDLEIDRRMSAVCDRQASRARKRVAGFVAAAGGKTLTERAYQELEERIVTLQLKPGEFISEYALAHDLKIGRTPIREALQRLSREDLVTILPRKGILVAETDPRKQLLVLEVSASSNAW